MAHAWYVMACHGMPIDIPIYSTYRYSYYATSIPAFFLDLVKAVVFGASGPKHYLVVYIIRYTRGCTANNESEVERKTFRARSFQQ